MAENFDLIYAVNASMPYTWADADYKQGWEIVGNIPPTAEQFNALQQRSDRKSQELNNKVTPLVERAKLENRQPHTAYRLGDIVITPDMPLGWYLQCITTGTTSNASSIVLPTPLTESTAIADGTVVWILRKTKVSGDELLTTRSGEVLVTRSGEAISVIINPQPLIIRFNGGNTEGLNKFTYNGTETKTPNITAGAIGAYTKNEIDARLPATGTYSKSEIDTKLNGYVPTSRTVNDKALSDDISLTAEDVGAVPTTRKVAGKPLSADVTLSAVTFNSDGGGAAGSTAYDGSIARTISYNTIGAAPLASPAFTGTPTAPTPATTDNSTKIATTAFVKNKIESLAGYVTDFWYSGYSWYRKWNNGWIEQGGIDDRYEDRWLTVNLHTPFTTTNYAIQMTRYEMNGRTSQCAFTNYPTKTTTSFERWAEGQGGSGFSAPSYVYWYACGY